MDSIVKAAMAKWPLVPACYGWLGLDARGRWWMRDAATQAQGPFPQAKGSLIEHEALLGFIGRNYGLDTQGAAVFQNGPQKVFVELEAAPWVWRLHTAPLRDGVNLCSHTGLATQMQSLWLDEQDRLFASSPLGLGLVHSLDMELAATALEQGWWEPPAMLPWHALCEQMRVVPSPLRLMGPLA
jgi:hypothetical protein